MKDEEDMKKADDLLTYINEILDGLVGIMENIQPPYSGEDEARFALIRSKVDQMTANQAGIAQG